MITVKKPFLWILNSFFIHGIFLFYIMSYQNKPHIPQVVKPLEAINIEFFKSDNMAKKSSPKHNNTLVKVIHPTRLPPKPVKITTKTVTKTPILKVPTKKIAVIQKPVPQKKTIPQKIAIVPKPAIQKNTPAVDSVVTGSINPTTNPTRSVAVQKTLQNDSVNNTAVKTQVQAHGGNKGATAVFQPKAKYTSAMLRKRMKGVVSVKLFFDVDGKVSDYKIIKSTRHKLLNQAVVSACRQYRIKPPLKSGKAITYTDLCIQEMTYN
jgi:TonB family protein